MWQRSVSYATDRISATIDVMFGAISSLLSKKSSAEERAQVYIVPLNRQGRLDMTGAWAFQYWPESIQIGYAPVYGSKALLGGSMPLKQWTNNGPRVLSFMAEFSRDLQGKITDPGFIVPGDSVARDEFNVDVSQALVWLEALEMPLYDESVPGGVEEPPLLWLVMPNVQLGRAYGTVVTDVFQCKLMGTQATIDAFFPDGTPRHMTVGLSFEESVQNNAGVQYPGRDMKVTIQGGLNPGESYKVAINKQKVHA